MSLYQQKAHKFPLKIGRIAYSYFRPRLWVMGYFYDVYQYATSAFPFSHFFPLGIFAGASFESDRNTLARKVSQLATIYQCLPIKRNRNWNHRCNNEICRPGSLRLFGSSSFPSQASFNASFLNNWTCFFVCKNPKNSKNVGLGWLFL